MTATWLERAFEASGNGSSSAASRTLAADLEPLWHRDRSVEQLAEVAP